MIVFCSISISTEFYVMEEQGQRCSILRNSKSHSKDFFGWDEVFEGRQLPFEYVQKF